MRRFRVADVRQCARFKWGRRTRIAGENRRVGMNHAPAGGRRQVGNFVQSRAEPRAQGYFVQGDAVPLRPAGMAVGEVCIPLQVREE